MRPGLKALRRHCPAAVLAALLTAAGCSSGDPIGPIEDRREVGSRELVELLAHGRRAEKIRAARAMGRIQHPSYAADLAVAASVGEPDLRREALFALGQLGLARGAQPPDAAVRAATDALADPSAEIVEAAVEALGKLAAPGAAEALVPLFEHASPQVRTEVATALFRLQFVPVWRGQSVEAARLPVPAVRALVQALDDPEPVVRAAAAHAFSRFGQPDAVEALGARVADEHEWVRLFAARALGRSGDASGASALEDALRDPSFRVRTEAVIALGALGEQWRLPEWLAADETFQVRAETARALGGGDSGASLEWLRRLADDSSETVRAAAIGALARRQGASYAPALESLLQDPRWTIRRAAAAAARDAGDEASRLVTLAWADADVRVRTAALESAKGLVDAEPIVAEALASDDLALRGTAVGLLDPVGRAEDRQRLMAVWEASPGDAWIEVREGVVDALAADPAAVTQLARIAAEDAAPSVRTRAATALGESPSPPEAPAPESPYLGVAFDEDPIVVLETSRGTLEIRCLAREAPIHVAHFVDLVRHGFYDGLAWHRVVSNFVVQGGDPRGDGWGSGDIVVRDEINRVRFERGTLGMPKAGKDTGGCQLFFALVPTPHLDGNYTVFGKVEQGIEVLDRLEVGDVIVSARVR